MGRTNDRGDCRAVIYQLSENVTAVSATGAAVDSLVTGYSVVTLNRYFLLILRP